MAIESLRKTILEKISVGNPLMQMYMSPKPLLGWVGTFPDQHSATMAVGGESKYNEYVDDDRHHHHIPNLSFEIAIVRQLISPFKSREEGLISVKSSGMQANIDEKHQDNVKLKLQVAEDGDFFSFLDAIRQGDRFYPFQVTGGDREIIDRVKSRYGVRIHASISIDEVDAFIPDVSHVDLESIIIAIIEAFNTGSPALEELKSLYQELDADGTRLLIQKGLQKPEFYKRSRKIRRNILNRVTSTLKHHRIEYQTNWALGGLVKEARQIHRDLGPFAIPAIPIYFSLMAGAKAYRFLFLSEEKLREKRLQEYKQKLQHK